MKQGTSIFSVDHLVDYCQSTSMSPDGKNWYPARPMGNDGIKWRIWCAWQVFTGKADVIRWPAGQ